MIENITQFYTELTLQKDKMPKIFVTNYNPEFSYEMVHEHGDPIYMSQGFVPPTDYGVVMSKFRAFAETASAEDHLLLSGANVLVAMAVAAWLDVHGAVNVLQHTKKKNEHGKIVPAYASFELALTTVVE
jgi:hypothetical protein